MCCQSYNTNSLFVTGTFHYYSTPKFELLLSDVLADGGFFLLRSILLCDGELAWLNHSQRNCPASKAAVEKKKL